MLKGVDINQRIEFSCVDDKEEPRTIFVFKPLSGFEMLDLSKHLVGKKLTLSGSYILETLEKSIVEIKNPDLKDKDKIKEFLQGLSSIVLVELVTETGKINKLTDDESKN